MKMIGYLPLGYPSLEKSIEMADAYIEGGCDGIEISIPCPDPRYEKDTIKKWMQQAYESISDYRVYFEAVCEIRGRHPEKEIYTMVYQEVLSAVTPEVYADFCVRAGIDCVISADLTEESAEALEKRNVSRCSFGSFILDPKRLRNCLRNGGMIYMQTKPFPGQSPLPGYESLEAVIRYMRDLGITRPIYCGGGIQSPEDAKSVKKAGADGFFVGTAIVTLSDDLGLLRQTLREYKEAAES